MDKLNLITIFLKVSHLGSFAAASAKLGVDPSTVSKAIRQLEQHLKLRLFNRTTRKLQLTSAGETYRQTCAQLLHSLDICEQQLHTEQHLPKGLLRINLPVAYGQLYVMPLVGRFCEAYPDIQLEISLTDNYVDMVSQSIDIAIRSGHLQASRLIARKLSPMDFAICASPKFIKHAQQPLMGRHLENQPWILYRFMHTGKVMPIYGVKKGASTKQHYEFTPKAVLTTTDGLAMLTAGKAGVGLVQAPHFLIRDAVNCGELELVQSYYRSEQFGVYAYYLNKGYVPAKVKVFLDFMVKALEKKGESHNTTFLSAADSIKKL